MNYQQNQPFRTYKLCFRPKNQITNSNKRLQNDLKDWEVSEIFIMQNKNTQEFHSYLGGFFYHIIQKQNLFNQLSISIFLSENEYSNLALRLLKIQFPTLESFLFNQNCLQNASQSLQVSFILSIDQQEQKFQYHQSKFEGIISLQTSNNQQQLQFGNNQQQPQFRNKLQQPQFGNKQQQLQFGIFQLPQQFPSFLNFPPNNIGNKQIFQFQNPIPKFPPSDSNTNFQPPLKNINHQKNFSNFPQQKQPIQQKFQPQPILTSQFQFQPNFLPNQEKSQINVMTTIQANAKLDPQLLKTLNQEGNLIEANIKFTTSLLDCPICFEKIIMKENETYVTPCCNKKIHKKCLEVDLQHKAQQFKLFSKITCCCCYQPYKNEFFVDKIDKNILQEILLTEIASKCKTCFKCKSKILQTEENQKETCLKCNSCQQKICNKCFAEYHGNTICKSIREEILDVFKGQPILVCPFCNLPSTKNDECDHVKCWDCKMDLCSYCSVDRRPIENHGNHFHRIGCKHYAAPNNLKKDQVSEKIRNCDLCQTQTQGCEFPKDLETYRKEKNY